MRITRRSAFTLVELVVAVALLGIGAVGLAAASAFLAHASSEASASSIAASAATRRLELLRSVPCAAIAAGSARARGVTEQWSAAALSPGIVDVSDSVSYDTNRGARSQLVRSYVAC